MKKAIIHINNKFFKFDLEYFFKNSFYTVCAYIISILCTFGITYIIANGVSEHHAGVYRYVFSWYGILSSCMLAGITSALTISIAKGFNSLKQALTYKAWFSFLGVLMSLGIAGYYFVNGNTELFWCFVLLAISLPALEITNLYSSYQQGQEDFKGSSRFIILNKAITLASILIFVFLLNFRNSYMLIISNILIIGIVQILYIRKIHTSVEDELEKKTDTGLLRNALHLSFMGIVFTLGQQADKLILFNYFGSAVLASYWIATTVPLEAQRFVTQIATIYMPKLVKADGDNPLFRKKFIQTLLVSSGLMIILSALYYVLAPFIFQLLFPKYTDMVSLSRLFFCTVIFLPFSFVWNYFLAQSHLKNMYLLHIGDPVLQIALYALCIFVFNLGIMGLVYAIIAKTIIINAWGMYLFLKKQ